MSLPSRLPIRATAEAAADPAARPFARKQFTWYRLRIALGLVLLVQFAGYEVARGQGWVRVETMNWSAGPETTVTFQGNSTALRIAFWPMWQVEALLDGGTFYLVNEF